MTGSSFFDPRLLVAGVTALVLSCKGRQSSPSTAAPVDERIVTVSTPVDAVAPGAPAAKARPQIDGHDFPDGVVALTWDDGPDAHTLELARYLHARRVSGTFFVVREWRPGVSDDPGFGPGVTRSGYHALPILPELVQLGQRIGNHTLNHVLLPRVDPPAIAHQLVDNQRELDGYQSTAWRFFRVPGGAWDEAASAVVDGDAVLRRLTGPVRWDVDRKDWDSSVSCESTSPAEECETWAGSGGPDGRLRTKPKVVAARYLASIEEAKHGIVLLHDRVGDVGSRYALELAEMLLPALEARGYVFSAPVLAFAPLVPLASRSPASATENLQCRGTSASSGRAYTGGALFPSGSDLQTYGDLNGDGRLDACARRGDDLWCAFGQGHDRFTAPSAWVKDSATIGDAVSLALMVENGDGRDDLCVTTKTGRFAALTP